MGREEKRVKRLMGQGVNDFLFNYISCHRTDFVRTDLLWQRKCKIKKDKVVDNQAMSQYSLNVLAISLYSFYFVFKWPEHNSKNICYRLMQWTDYKIIWMRTQSTIVSSLFLYHLWVMVDCSVLIHYIILFVHCSHFLSFNQSIRLAPESLLLLLYFIYMGPVYRLITQKM